MTIEDINKEIQNEVEFYFELHPNKTPDLIDHCLKMQDDLYQYYIDKIDKGIIIID